MADIIKFITELLARNKSVILPDLGCFILSYKAASFVGSTAAFEPAQAVVSFNSNQTEDDGELVQYTASVSSLSVELAEIEVGRFTAKIKNEIKINGQAELLGLGTLYLDKSSELVFKQSPDLVLNKHFWNLPAINATPIDPAFNNLAVENRLGDTGISKGFRIGIIIFFLLAVLLILALSALLAYQYYLEYQVDNPELQNKDIKAILKIVYRKWIK